MTINKHRHHIYVQPKATLFECLNEKSLNVLRSLGYNPEEIREKNKIKEKMPMVVNKIRSKINTLDHQTLRDLKTMCYVGRNPANDQPIIRPFRNKIIDLFNYVNSNSNFRSSN